MSNKLLTADLGANHLMSLLLAEYRGHVAGLLEQRKAKGQRCRPLDEAVANAPLEHFYKFAVAYLTVNRPTEAYCVADNYGVRLTNNIGVAISPPTPGEPEYGYGSDIDTGGAVGVTVTDERRQRQQARGQLSPGAAIT